MKVFLPDGTELDLDEGASGADAAAAIGAGLARAALGIRVDGELRDLSAPLGDGARIEIVTARDDDGLWLLRHDAAHVLAAAVHGALPRREDLDRPADRGRLLLRLRVPGRRQADSRRTSSASRPKMREHIKADESFERSELPPCRRDRALPRGGTGLQGRADRGPREGGRPEHPLETRLALPQRPVHGPLPRPARAGHQAHQGLQAHERGGRLLARGLPTARCSRASTGPPSSSKEDARGAPAAARGGARARPPQAGSRAGAVHALRPLAGVAVLAAERHAHLERANPALARPPTSSAATQEVRTPILYDVELWKQSGHWHVYREQHVLHGRRGPPDGPQAHELPGARPDLQERAALLPRPPDPLRRAGPRPPPRAERHAARSAARAPHHPGRRARLLHRGADRGGGDALPRLRLLHLRAVRLQAAPRAVDPAGEAGRHRGDVGQGRGGAAADARAQRARVRAERGRRRLLRAQDRRCT